MPSFGVIRLHFAKPSFGLLLVGLLFITGCAKTARPLMPTPVLYQTKAGGKALFANTHPERRTAELELLYITNRAPETAPDSDLPYSDQRSRSLIFGSLVVTMVPNLTWADLQEQSRLGDRTKQVNLQLTEVRERGRFPEEPYDLKVTSEGRLVRSPTTLAQHRLLRARFESVLREQLRRSPSNEVVLYVHGRDESYVSAAYTMADLCHYLGREHVCVIFSWPASASATIGHLRKAIRMIGQTPGVEGVHLLTHGRGAAVLLNALRELTIETVAAGVAPADALKLTNLVLIAPDLDQDIGIEQLGIFTSDPDMISLWPYDRIPTMLKGRMTVYSCPEDRGLSASWPPFRRDRGSQLSLEQLGAASRIRMAKLGKLDFIVCNTKRTRWSGHSYFHSSPLVTADLIQVIRYNKQPGESGRLLKKVGPMAWTFAPSKAASTRH